MLPQPHGSGVGLSEVTFSGSGLTTGTPTATVGQDNITTQGQAGQETQLRLNQISYDPEGYKNWVHKNPVKMSEKIDEFFEI